MINNIENDNKTVKTEEIEKSEQFYVDEKKNKMMCRCGYHATYFRYELVCSSLTIKNK